jgi:AraC-like DNA-binding protein
MEMFRRNPNLKIAELWPMSGFNSIVSFNMAFRLFVNESPSEWCRKEKKKLKAKSK